MTIYIYYQVCEADRPVVVDTQGSEIKYQTQGNFQCVGAGYLYNETSQLEIVDSSTVCTIDAEWMGQDDMICYNGQFVEIIIKFSKLIT